MARTAAARESRRKGARTSSHYSRWSNGEIRELRQLARTNMPMREIGRKLGRTAVSIRGKAQREGISLKMAASFGRRSRGKH